jgi:hypothetical protein
MSQLAALFDRVPTWVWVASIAGVTLLGFLNLLRQVRDADQKLTFSSEFREKFISYVNSRGRDREVYHEMMLQSNRMQAEMGPFGVWHHFRDPPFEYKNYGIILNGLPRIRREFEEERTFSRADDLIQMFDDALVRFLGTLDEDLNESKKSLRNPLACFRRGAEQVALLPFLFFAAFGVIGRATVASIRAAWVFKFLTAALALLGLAASIIALLVDGSEAWGIVRGWLWGAPTPADPSAMPSSGSADP